MLDFRAESLRRWPGLADMIGPWHHDLGWVAEEHLIRMFQHISEYIGCWFGYPLEGVPRLLVRLARSPGSSVVSVRVEGAMDALLAARVETLLDVL